MCYDIEFPEQFYLDRPLSEEHYDFLSSFRFSTKGNVYDNGGYLYDKDSIPESHCQWLITLDRKGIEYGWKIKPASLPDRCKCDKYQIGDHIEWLQYLITNFLEPWGYILSGKVKWSGKNKHDTGTIIIKENRLKIVHDCNYYSKDALEAHIVAQKKYIEYLENHIRYMPDGPGALEAKEHFLRGSQL